MNRLKKYKELLNINDYILTKIEHNDAIVAEVYLVTKPNNDNLILKICPQDRHYFREVYFLNHFKNILPVPNLIAHTPPTDNQSGAILIEFINGKLLTKSDTTGPLAYNIGSLLAQIHENKTGGYGDIANTRNLESNPCNIFLKTFNNNLQECKNIISKTLSLKLNHYCQLNLELLLNVDGPCITHCDFRPGNLIAKDNIIKGIIDWSGAQSSFAEKDFCSMEHYNWYTNPDDKKLFLNGYASIRPLPNYKSIMPLLRLNKALGTVGFIINRNSQLQDSKLYKFNLKFIKNFFNN